MTQPVTADNSTTAITRMERTISSLLRGGIVVSLSLVLIGVIVMFVHHPEYAHSRETLNYLKGSDYHFPTSIGDIFEGVAQGQGRAIVMLGVFVLFLTPLSRVVASVITFAIQKDWTFTAITSLVLCFVIVSLILGKSG